MGRIDEVLDYIQDWKNNREIRKKFSLSVTEWWNLSNYMLKLDLIERLTGYELQLSDKKLSRVMFYKQKPEKK